MCGIIAIVGREPAAPRLLESLRRLEYRGYDSAGVATLVDGQLHSRRAEGKIRNLEAVLAAEPLPGNTGIGHTRWATHGVPAERNAHPQIAGRVAVVHNGIIENFAELKAELVAAGRRFASDTDTEVIAHLIDARLDAGDDPKTAFKTVLDRLRGAYALGVLVQGHEDLALGARRGSPLVVGWGEGEMFLGSDAMAVGPFTRTIAYLEEGDFAVIARDSAAIFDGDGAPVDRPQVTVAASAALVEKGNYRHFMEKEIHEEAEAVQHTLAAYVDPVSMSAVSPGGFDFAAISRLQIVACGGAYYAAAIARYHFERIAGLPCDVEIASEYRYREPAVTEGSLALAVSQSGETADTLAALRWCKAQGLVTAALVNVPGSSMAREVDHAWHTHAGPEIGVASTKAFAAQVAALSALAVVAARQRGRIDAAEERRLVTALMGAPRLIAQVAQDDAPFRALAQELARARDVLYLGRGPMYGLALEGALKLKEISYIHAEGYAGGELKHGPIALIDEDTPVVVLAPHDAFFEKMASNMQEVAARGGKLVLITDSAGRRAAGDVALVAQAPDCDAIAAPLVFTPAVHLLAYHVAVLKGTDVDQPRNLAKSVTVE